MTATLVTGARGQLGSELVASLRQQSAAEQVVTLDLEDPSEKNGHEEMHVTGDVRDRTVLEEVLGGYDVHAVYHLASLLSATGEKHPDLTWDVNMTGLKHLLDLAREHGFRLFWPSSIAVFGPNTPKDEVPQETVLEPVTMYGITKRSGELLCRYYYERYGVDVRSLRYPGLISHTTKPGGGTTDYAVDIFYAAIRDEEYTCFVGPETRLPMMYMPDAIRAATELMEAGGDSLSVRTSYNIGAMSFTARELAAAITEHIPSFRCRFEPDERQAIADTWPASVDDSAARSDWGWKPEYRLPELVEDMLDHLHKRYSEASSETVS